jgi:hypothetical protein
MKRNEVVKLLNAHRHELEGFGVESLTLFGSTARDHAKPGSDVDVLVEFDGGATFDRYMNLKFYLEDLLGVPVDLVTRKALRDRVRESIEREAVYVS